MPPIHRDFHSLLNGLTDQYCDGSTEETRRTEEVEGYPAKTCRKALSVFYGMAAEQGFDYSKPRPKKESFGWAGSVKPIEGVTNLIRGKALHPIRTVHPEEWPHVREYLEEELQKSAHTLTGKPLLLDHSAPLKGEVLAAEYEDGAVEYIAKLDDVETLDKIRQGKIKHCSVELEWDILQNVDGVAPKGINFTGLSLLENLLPGDPKTTVEVWEGLIARLKEAKNAAPQPAGVQPASPAPPKAEGVENMNEEELKRLVESTVKAVLKEQEDEREKLRQAQRERAEKYGIQPKEGGHLTKPREYENVPEDQFADPVNYRYPIDKEHVRAALTYFNQADNRQAGGYTHEEAVKIMTKIINAALNAGIEVSWQPEDPVYRGLPEELKKKLAGYEAAEGKKKGLGEAIIAPTVPQNDLISRKEVLAKLEAIIPPRQVIFSYGQTGGFKRLVENIQRVKREIEKGMV